MKARACLLGLGLAVLGLARFPDVGWAQASPFVEIGSWEAELVERLRAGGALRSLAAVSRPHVEADVLEALREVDTLRLSGVERVWYRELERELLRRRVSRRRPVGATLRFEPGLRLGTAPTLDPFVIQRSGGVYPAASAAGAVQWGWVVAAFEGEWTRREAGEAPVGDPGVVAFRAPVAYVRVARTWGDFVLGRVRWELGAEAPESLVLGARPEPLPGLAWSVGSQRFRFRQVVSRLDRINEERRYLSMHRLEFRPVSGLDVGLTETVVWAGRGRGWELGYLNPLVVYFSEQVNDAVQPGNVKYAVDLAWRPHRRVELYGQVLIDDLTWEEGWPHRLGWLTGVRAGGVLPRVSFEAYGAKASALLYQSWRLGEAYVYRGQGIGSNRTDYERFSFVLHWDVLPWARFSPVYERLRQGPRNLWMLLPVGSPPLEPHGAGYVTDRMGIEGVGRLGTGLVARFSASYLKTDASGEEWRWRAGERLQGWIELQYRWGVAW